LKHFVLVTALVIFFASCAQETSNRSRPATVVDTIPLPLGSTTLYFPSKPQGKDSMPDAFSMFTNQWYSQKLFGLKEPILYNNKDNKEFYRFTWLRSFDHPVSIRLKNWMTT
jgi:hypothetical protein